MNLRVENLHYVFNQGTPLEIRALKGVSFALTDGKALGILGGTGSGKTTLVRNLGGLLVPTEGRVLIDGRDTRSYGADLRRKIGLVFQRPERQLFEETVFKDISFVLRRFSGLSDGEINDKVRTACELVGLNLTEVGARPPSALSDGEKRKVALAAILVNDPETVMLDEPAVGLDPPSVADLVGALEKMKGAGEKTLVIVSHDMEYFLPILDLMMVLDHGRVAAFGSPGEVCDALADDPAMEELLPGLALLVRDLRKAGYPLDPDEFRASVLACRISRSDRAPGDVD